ncbi:hypothetical protein [Timonella senegalensis]|uniref:hypothetical protein n=1 Tax=Timonella senegalensis TaxID=1465825 RepID=UPI0002DFAB0A|nr:hypothetical protein [Timonella senegalensis]
MVDQTFEDNRAALIDTLARAARSTESGRAQQENDWRDLWREVLPLERWFFIKDDSTQVTPILLKDGDNIILPAFTDADRAIEFSKDFGGKDRVYSSAPGSMITSAEELEKSGVNLVVFNPQNEPFAVMPTVLQQLAEGYVESGEGRIVGGQHKAPESDIDVLAYYARSDVNNLQAISALWIATLLLDEWYFVPVGEGENMQPFAVLSEAGATVLAFTTPKRAGEYAALRGMGQLEQVFAMTPAKAVELMTHPGFEASAVQFDPQHGSYHSVISQLPAMLKIAESSAEAQRRDQDDRR